MDYSVEFLQNYSLNQLINILEDNKIYSELQNFNIDIDLVKAINPTHEQIMELIEKIRQVEKAGAFLNYTSLITIIEGAKNI